MRLSNFATTFLFVILLWGLSLERISAQSLPGVEIESSSSVAVVVRLSSLQPTVAPGNQLVNPLQHWFFQNDTGFVPELRGIVAVPSGATNLRVEEVPTGAELGAVRYGSALRTTSLPEISILGQQEYAGVRLVTVGVRPYEFDGTVLRVPREVRLRITWDYSSSGNGAGRGNRVSLSRMEREVARDIPNYADALVYSNRLTEKPGAAVSSSSTSGWGLGEEALVLLVEEDGPYRLDAAGFVESGGPASPPIDRLRLARRDESVPLFVADRNDNGQFDGNDYLSFRGHRNRSDDGHYYSEITDTNAYVLTWSGGDGEGPEDVMTLEPIDTPVETYMATLHFEEERTYFHGMSLPQFLENDEATVHVTERVQHERYYWGSITDSRRESFRFVCSPAYRSGADVRMDVRMVGINYSSTAYPPQTIRAFVNGFDVGSIQHSDTTDTMVSFTFPGNVLINGTNQVRFDYASDTIEMGILIDYLEITGEWNVIAEKQAVALPTDQGSAYRIDGFRTGSTGEEGVEIDAVDRDHYGTSSDIERGHLLRVTSRAGTQLRPYPGFFLAAGDDQISADDNWSLGVTVAEVEPRGDGLEIIRSLHVGTANSVSSMDEIADFIDEVRNGNIVVAGTAFGTAQQEKSSRFISSLRSLGSSVVETESFFASSWVFAAVKGVPGSAVEEYERGGDRGISTNLFIPDSQRGRDLRASVAVPASDTGTLLVSVPASPDLRYHDEDRLLDPSNRADLIIVTHPLFASEAERLADHRRSFSGLEVAVVDVYRIYDEFNHGIKDPVAIRRFLQYADTNWGGGTHAPSFVILFGDANWDAQQRMEGSVMIDYLPSFGVPSTDQKFVVAFGDTTLTPQQFIGRLPATSVAEARSVVDKLIRYDQLPPAEWNKKFVFATGGQDVEERDRLRDDALSFASIVTSDRFFGEAEVISRTGTTNAELAFPNTIDAPRVQAAMNRGGVWLDFMGHGATTTLDLNFGYPEDFDNRDRYFVFATWSCQTGLFSNRDAQLRNESFLFYPEKGSIASIGGTSFSFTNMDNSTRRLIFSKIANEPQSRTIGSIFHLSKLELFAQYFYGSPSVSFGTRARNQTMMYTLLGDPSMRIAVSSTPELTIPVESVRLVGERSAEPALGDTALVVRGALWNFGVPLDIRHRDTAGVVYSVTLVDPHGGETVVVDTLFGLRRHDSIEISLPMGDTPGEYVVVLETDIPDLILEEDEADNRTVVQFLLRGSQPLALEPLANGIVSEPEDVEIRILNPASGPGARFLIDTVPEFNSPALRSSDNLGSVVERELTTSWNLSIPQEMRGADVLWWRATSTSADAELAERYPLTTSFRIRRDEPPTQHYAVGGIDQMSLTRLEDLVNTADGVGPGERLVPIEVTSIGQTFQGPDNSTPQIVVPKLTIRVGSMNYRVNSIDGLNILVFPPNDVHPVIDTFFTFYTGTPLSAVEDLVENHIVPGQLVIVGTSGVSLEMNDSDADARLSAVLDQLGSRIADTIKRYDWWGSYALIGGKGRPDGQVREGWIPGGELYQRGELAPFPVTVRDTIVAFPRKGRWTSQIVGPALEWRNATVDIALGELGTAELQTLGVRKDGRRDTIRTETLASATNRIDLQSIDALTYPRLEFSVVFEQDTTQRLHRVDVDFQPAPELAVVPSSVRIDQDSVLQGNPVRFEATVANLTSFSEASSVPVWLVELGETGGIIDTVAVEEIAPLDSAKVTFDISTTRLRSARSYYMDVNPADTPSEPYSHNNRSRPLAVTVSTDGVAPGLAIYADDNRLLSGDYVAPQPTFEIRMFDNSTLELDRVTAVTLVLDNEWITVESGGEFEFPTTGEGDLRGTFRYVPPVPLEEGAHDLRVFARDATGNGDTTEIITFYVESTIGVRSLYTWPNPMQKETTFTFTITGAAPPESGEIAVFTPAGRKIRTIALGPGELSIGNNRVDWDGRDTDGDRLANGIYLYRLVLQSGEERIEVIDKIAVLR